MNDNKSTLFADRIYMMRASKRLQQKELASAIGVDAPTYSRIEKGQRTPNDAQIELLARILEVDSCELKSLVIADRIHNAIGGFPVEETKLALEKVKSTL